MRTQFAAALLVLLLACPRRTEAQITVDNAITCNGTSTAQLTVVPGFGTGPYTYVWSNGAVVPTIINLSAGVYSVTVTDALLATAVYSQTLLDPPLLTVSVVSTNVSCNGGNNGTATATGSGGTGLLTYLWSTGGATNNVINLAVGNYSVTVTDLNGCTATNSVVITEPATPIQTFSLITNVLCFGLNTGDAAVIASGGTGVLTYVWNTGATTTTITNLVSGPYSVTVTDGSGCIAIATVVITQPATPVQVSIASTNVSCNGGNNGTATATGSGGTGALSYLWNTGAVVSNLSNLTAGNYSVTVTDLNGCTATDNVVITEPLLPLQVAVVSTNVNCFGATNGTATATGSGGTGVITYLWSNGAVTATITNLTAGNYSVTVTDANGCIATGTAVITEPATPVQAFTMSTNVTCNGDNSGTASVIASGGTGVLSYLWSTGAVTTTIANLIAGNYSVTVTDANGCMAIANVVITQPIAPVQVSIVPTGVHCFGGNDGSAFVIASGGTGVLSYLWSTGAVTTTIANLIAGNYSLTVTDANGCAAVINTTITQPLLISVVPTITPSSCDGLNTGAISILVSGGTPAYTFLWHELLFDSTYVTQNLVGVRGGTYALTITDINGCTFLDTLIIPNNVTVPFTSTLVPYVCNGATGSVTVQATNADTLIYFTYSWSSIYNTGSFTTNDSVFSTSTNFVAGTYTITVTDNATGCAAYYDFTINQSLTPLVVAPIVHHNLCYNDMNGSISLQVNGGNPMPGYHVTWTGPNGFSSTAFSLSGLAVGDYTYIVTDDSVCSTTGTIRIEPLTPLLGYVTSENVLCNSTATGHAEAFYSGGTGPLSYLWSNGVTTPFINNLLIGTYTLTVTDSVGCSILTSAIITQPPVITIVLDSLQNIHCNGGNDGGIWLTTAGGTGNLFYTWLLNGTIFPQVTEDIVNIPAGNYSVSVMDSVGCSAVMSFTLTQPAATIYLDSIHVISCNNGSDGYWQIMPVGPNFPYVAIFSTGDTISTDTVPAPFISGLVAGSYSVTITSSIGCDSTFTLVLQQPLPLTVGTVDIVPILCKGASTGSITMDAVYGGTGPYTFLWDNGMITNPIINIPANMYNVTITDALGCVIYETYEVEEPYEWIKFFAIITSTTCQQSSDGQIVVNTEDIYWSPFTNAIFLYDSLGVLVDSVSPGEAIGNLPSGFYEIILINQYGCTMNDSLYVGQGPGDCILIPNLVTTNGDGFNDVFSVQGACEYDEFSVKIFTDNGEQVFQSSDCLFTWDPLTNQATPNSVYYYYISVTENGKLYEFKSSINIQK